MKELIKKIIKETVLITEKKKKKSKTKKDACYHKVKARYDVWPSAYASGALSKSTTKEDFELEEKRKLTKKPSSENSLRDWFKRKGEKGSTGGWVDCNAPDGKGGYKSCGRKSGEERKKYPLYNNKQKAELIKRWIDASNKFLLKNKKKIKKSFMKNVNDPQVRNSKFTYGWNELLVYDVKVKDAFIVLDSLAASGDEEGLESGLKHVQKILKPYVKGKIYQGFADSVKRFIKQRGGKA